MWEVPTVYSPPGVIVELDEKDSSESNEENNAVIIADVTA